MDGFCERCSLCERCYDDDIEPATVPVRRRDRLRSATLAEIKSLAWEQIAENGAAALSLRAIARDMGMTSSALYRYYESRDQLIDELIRDGFASLADALEEAEEATDDRSVLPIALAYRRWALSHRTEYAVMFGLAAPELATCDPQTKAEMGRGVDVLFRVMTHGLAAGTIDPPALHPAVAKRLRPKLRKWKEEAPPGLTIDSLAACMFVWTQLHGAISLEMADHLPGALTPADELFEHLIREAMRAIGCLRY